MKCTSKKMLQFPAELAGHPSKNAVSAWKKLLKQAREEGASGIHFPRGEYHFYPGGCERKFLYFSNNDAGEKILVFHLEGWKNFSLTGDRARLIFHGRLTPLFCRNCENLQIKGLEIDFADDFALEADVEPVDAGRAWVTLQGKYWLEENRIRFFRDAYDNEAGRLRFQAYDAAEDELGRGRNSSCVCPNQVLARKGRRLLLPLPVSCEYRHFFLRPQPRQNPGMVFLQCRDVQLSRCTIHHAGGMGVLMQNVENGTVEEVKVIPSGRRHIAVTDDAMHFVECSGQLLIRHCELRNTLDDAINIHGIYRRLRRHPAGGVFVETAHFQQLGTCWLRPGEKLEFSKPDTMKPYAVRTIASLGIGNPQVQFLTFEEPLPEEFVSGDVVRGLTSAGLVAVIEDNLIRNNRPRGILLTGVRKGVIRRNTIHSPGAGVYLSGDMNFWYESGANGEVLITENLFDRCNYSPGTTGLSPVTIKPEVGRRLEDFQYHGTVRVEKNVFRMESANPIVRYRSVSRLSVKENEIHYPEGEALPPSRQILEE